MGQELCPNKNQIIKDFNQNKQNNAVSNVSKEKKDKINDHTIKMISIVDEFTNSVCNKKLMAAKQYAKALSSFNHPNIAKYIDESQTDSNYFIKIEKYESTLLDFIKNTPIKIIDEQQYIEFTLQMLYAIQYLHQNKNYLRYISLKDILIDANKQIKLYEFESTESIFINKTLKCLESQEIDKNFYIPPEFLQQSNEEYSDMSETQNIKGDIWLFGISLYILAGANFSHATQLTKGVESYQIQKNISLEINLILVDILIRNSKATSIDDMIERFKYIKIKKELQKEQRIFEFVQQCFDHFEFKVSFKYLEKLIEMNPSNDQYIAMKGRAYLEVGKLDEAQSISLKCLEINPQNDLAISNLGYCQYQNDEFEKALEYIDKCISINSNNYLALNYKAYVIENRKQYEDAIQIHKDVLERNPNYIHALTGIGAAYRSQQKYDQAIDFYKQALNIKSDHMDAIQGLGLVYLWQGKCNQALEYLEKGLEIQPNSYDILNAFGYYYEQIDQIDKAIDYYKKSLQVEPKLYSSYYQLGKIYKIQEKFDLAVKCFQKQLQLKPNNIQTNYELGYIYYNYKDYPKAIYYYNQELKINPDHGRAFNELGIVYDRQKMRDKAFDCFLKAKKLHPNDVKIIKNLENMKKLI